MTRFTFQRACRHCGSNMDRIKRMKWHRVLSKFIPVIHTECCNQRYLIYFPEADYKSTSKTQSPTVPLRD